MALPFGRVIMLRRLLVIASESTYRLLWTWGNANGGDLGNGTITVINLIGLIEDANNYIFNVTMKNATNTRIIAEDTNTGIIVDQTSPASPTLSPTSNTQITSFQTKEFTGTVVGANTTSCTYIIARGGASSGNDYITGSATHSANSCTFTKDFNATTEGGEWYWSITASDETNTSKSDSNIFSVQLPTSSGGLPQIKSSNILGTSGNTNSLFWIIGIILLVIVIYFIYKNI